AEDPGAQALANEYEALYNASRIAGHFFYDMLTRNPEGKTGMAYFRGRGFTDETIKKFGLGYSLPSWDGLLRHGEQEGIAPAILERAGLILKREDGSGYYDRFRGRAMFPIFSPSGKVIAFGARKIREDDQLAKYINSPETPIYSKSRTLYGLSHARDAIREKDAVILVEGYADLITVSQAGVRNIVASSGTALTEEQIRLIDRYTKTIILVYDADSAGSKATLRGVDLVIEQGLDVRVAELPEGEDPDSFVRKHGREPFQTLVDGAESFVDFKANYFRRLGMLASPEGKVRAIRSIVDTIARMRDELRRTVYVKMLAEKYGLGESLLYREIETALSASAREARRPPPPAPPPPQTALPVPPPPAQLPAAERDALKVMLEYGDEVIRFVFAYVEPAMFRHPDARAIASRLARQNTAGRPFEPSAFLDGITGESEKRLVSGLLMQKYEIAPAWKSMKAAPEEPDPWRLAEGSIVALRVRELDTQLEEVKRLFDQAAARGSDLREFHRQLRELQDEKRNLLANGLSRRDE
ncbi:MAG TPA: DNA primase, partial [Bacteroidota bacterium]